MAKIGVEWINDFPPPCDQNELSYCDETSVGFLNGMVSRVTRRSSTGATATLSSVIFAIRLSAATIPLGRCRGLCAFFVARVDECLKRLQRILRRQGR